MHKAFDWEELIKIASKQPISILKKIEERLPYVCNEMPDGFVESPISTTHSKPDYSKFKNLDNYQTEVDCAGIFFGISGINFLVRECHLAAFGPSFPGFATNDESWDLMHRCFKAMTENHRKRTSKQHLAYNTLYAILKIREKMRFGARVGKVKTDRNSDKYISPIRPISGIGSGIWELFFLDVYYKPLSLFKWMSDNGYMIPDEIKEYQAKDQAPKGMSRFWEAHSKALDRLHSQRLARVHGKTDNGHREYEGARGLSTKYNGDSKKQTKQMPTYSSTDPNEQLDEFLGWIKPDIMKFYNSLKVVLTRFNTDNTCDYAKIANEAFDEHSPYQWLEKRDFGNIFSPAFNLETKYRVVPGKLAKNMIARLDRNLTKIEPKYEKLYKRLNNLSIVCS